MTLSPERFREQLMGYLYGELEGNELREFEESLHTTEQYQSELASMREALRLSREGLAALRERDQAPPSRVSRAVLAAAAEAASEPAERPRALAQGPFVSTPARVDLRGGEREQQSFWSFLRTPWLLPTLGVAAAVSVVALHKQVESPAMPEYQTPTAQQAAPASAERAAEPAELGKAPPSAEPAQAPSTAASSGGAADEGAVGRSADVVESKRRRVPTGAHERTDEARARPQKAASDDGPSSKGYAVPPPAWSGLAREESEKKGTRPARAPDLMAEKAEELEPPPARDMGSDGFAAQGQGRAGGAVAAAKPATRTRASASQPASAPSAPAASAPTDDVALGAAPGPSTGPRPDTARAPDDAVKKALEHMEARRFGQAAVAYRELLQRYPKDSRAQFFRSQLGAALAALSNVDAIR